MIDVRMAHILQLNYIRPSRVWERFKLKKPILSGIKEGKKYEPVYQRTSY
jgi:hypothetical protein